MPKDKKLLPRRNSWDEPDAEEVLDDVKTFAALVEAKVRSPEVRSEWAELAKHLERHLEALKAADKERVRLEDEVEELNGKLSDAEQRVEYVKFDKEHCLVALREQVNKVFGFERWDDPMPLYELRRAVEDLQLDLN